MIEKTKYEFPKTDIIERLEKYLNSYVAFPRQEMALPVALWIAATHCYMAFDAFPYMVITSGTKQSGKTRALELIQFSCSNPRPLASLTGATMRYAIKEFPTLLIDEAEVLTGEQAGDLRASLNIGYRKGQVIPRVIGNELVDFETYSPKVFVLIGDVYDTLRDRSIVVHMRRVVSDNLQRFRYEKVKAEGAALAEEIKSMLGKSEDEGEGQYRGLISQMYSEFQGLTFLYDRDEEIWTPLFVVAMILCPHRVEELIRIAVDMAALKTADATKYFSSKKQEKEIEDHQYSLKLLEDMKLIFSVIPPPDSAKTGGRPKSVAALRPSDCIAALKSIPSSPWRTYKGDGLDAGNLAKLLSRFGLKQTSIRYKGEVCKGYDSSDVLSAANKHLPKSKHEV